MGNSRSATGEKAARELRVFLEFAEKSKLAIDPATIESRPPPEPDVRCSIHNVGAVAFELVELCNPELAKDIADQTKKGTPAKFLMLDDPSDAAFLSKLHKPYSTKLPIELLCYTGRTVALDDSILPTLRDLAQEHGLGPFRRVWFLGEETCEIVA